MASIFLKNFKFCLPIINPLFCILGLKCETQVDECKSSPCQNNGICKDGIGTFVCHCQPGYSGNLFHFIAFLQTGLVSVPRNTKHKCCVIPHPFVTGKLYDLQVRVRFYCI